MGEWPPKNPGQSPLPPRFCGNQSIAVANCLFPLVFLALGFCFCFCRALVSFPAARWPQMPSPIKMLLSEPISVIFWENLGASSSHSGDALRNPSRRSPLAGSFHLQSIQTRIGETLQQHHNLHQFNQITPRVLHHFLLSSPLFTYYLPSRLLLQLQLLLQLLSSPRAGKMGRKAGKRKKIKKKNKQRKEMMANRRRGTPRRSPRHLAAADATTQAPISAPSVTNATVKDPSQAK